MADLKACLRSTEKTILKRVGRNTSDIEYLARGAIKSNKIVVDPTFELLGHVMAQLMPSVMVLMLPVFGAVSMSEQRSIWKLLVQLMHLA